MRVRGGRLRTVTALAVLAALAVPAGGPAAALGGGDYEVRAWGQFGTAGEWGVPAAVTYDEKLVPPGARIEVRQRIAGKGMSVELRVAGLRPGHTYGTHVHTDRCGVDPQDSGPHYQHREGEDPELAHPDNEVWLDFTADAAGAGEASAWQSWTFRPGEAASVVLHEHATATGDEGDGGDEADAGHGGHDGRPGDDLDPGEAGARAGCFTVPFAHRAGQLEDGGHRAGLDGRADRVQ